MTASDLDSPHDIPDRTPPRPCLALVAHDNRKTELRDWALRHRAELRSYTLWATSTTGALIEESLDRPVHRLASGPLGGDLQLGAAIVDGRVDMLVFFWDPLAPQPHDPDIKALLRISVVWNIPIACNRATADLLLASEAVPTTPESSPGTP